MEFNYKRICQINDFFKKINKFNTYGGCSCQTGSISRIPLRAIFLGKLFFDPVFFSLTSTVISFFRVYIQMKHF